MPGWPLDIVSQVDTPWAQTSAQQVGWLAGSLADAYPEAGRHYWAFRTWGLLVWQPVYLTLAGIHLSHTSIRMECISQRATACMVWGCRIADHAPFEGDEDELFNMAATPLRDAAGALLDTCATTIGLHRKAAGRLQADYVTAAVLRIMALRPDWSIDDAVAWGGRWLESLGLRGAGGFLRYRDNAGAEHLAMERKICCLVYKRHDGFLCDTCPRIPLPDRLERLRQ
ncbi:MAG: siderophore ferric iron reductase [Pusillimonas sp.]